MSDDQSERCNFPPSLIQFQLVLAFHFPLLESTRTFIAFIHHQFRLIFGTLPICVLMVGLFLLLL